MVTVERLFKTSTIASYNSGLTSYEQPQPTATSILYHPAFEFDLVDFIPLRYDP